MCKVNGSFFSSVISPPELLRLLSLIVEHEQGTPDIPGWTDESRQGWHGCRSRFPGGPPNWMAGCCGNHLGRINNMAGDSRTCRCACAVAGPQLFLLLRLIQPSPDLASNPPAVTAQPAIMTVPTNCDFMLSHNTTAGYRAIPWSSSPPSWHLLTLSQVFFDNLWL